VLLARNGKWPNLATGGFVEGPAPAASHWPLVALAFSEAADEELALAIMRVGFPKRAGAQAGRSGPQRSHNGHLRCSTSSSRSRAVRIRCRVNTISTRVAPTPMSGELVTTVASVSTRASPTSIST